VRYRQRVLDADPLLPVPAASPRCSRPAGTIGGTARTKSWPSLCHYGQRANSQHGVVNLREWQAAAEPSLGVCDSVSPFATAMIFREPAGIRIMSPWTTRISGRWGLLR